MKRILSLLLTCCLLFSSFSFSGNQMVVNAEEGTTPGTTTGAQTVPEGYTAIRTIDDLYGINNDPSGKYILMNDLDISEETSKGGSWDTGNGWTPLKQFTGTLDGNGKRIIGMHMYGSSLTYVGLFSGLGAGAEIKNLGMVDVDISVDASYVGALAGKSYGGENSKATVINNCYVSGTIVGKSGYNSGFVGGVGYYNGTKVNNCINLAKIEADNSTYGFGENLDCYNCITVGKSNHAINGTDNSSITKDCYYLKSSASNSNGATSKTETQLKQKTTYTGYDFDNTWEIDSNCSSYPYIQLKKNRIVRVAELELTSKPTKITYYQGDKLDLAGGKVKITYEDGMSAEPELTSSMLDSDTADTIGTQMVTVYAGGKTVSFDITVIKPKNEFTKELICPDVEYDGSAYSFADASAKFGTVEYYYSASGDGIYTTKAPSDMGTYHVYAKVAETEAYYGIESEKKTFKINYPKAAVSADALIKEIGTVKYTLDSKKKIEKARKAYDALTTAQKALIDEETTKALTDAEATYKAFDEEAETKVPEGYQPIRTIEDLNGINNDPAGKYILMTDLDISEETSKGGSWDTGHGWTPLNQFTGTLDGNGKRIIGMHMYGSSLTYVGLFSGLGAGAEIKNLGMVDVDISVDASYVGALAGKSYGGENSKATVINNCYVSGTIVGKSGYNSGFVGGVGYYNGTKVNNCINLAKIEADNSTYGFGENLDCYNCITVGKSDHAINGTDNSSITKDCYYLKSSASKSNGATMKTADQLKKSETYTGYDFDNTWEIDPDCSYPYIQLKDNRIVRVEDLELTSIPTKKTYIQGDKLDLTGGSVKVTYEDGNEKKTAITADRVSGYDMHKIGKQNVTVTYGDKSQTFEIEVKGIPVTSLVIPETLEVYRSKLYQFEPEIKPDNATDKMITWKSEDESIASVDGNGLLKANKKGTTKIIATTANGLKKECTVTVLVASTKVKLNETELVLYRGDSATLTAQIAPSETTDTISWESSNPAVAEVTDGTVVAKSAGIATITAYTQSGVSEKCMVTVNKYTPELSITTYRYTKLLEDGAFKLDGIYTDSDGKIVYSVTKGSDVISVDEAGNVTPLKKGEAIITVSSAETDTYYQSEPQTITITITSNQSTNTTNPNTTNQNTVPSQNNKNSNASNNTSTSSSNSNAAAIAKVKKIKAKIKKAKSVKKRYVSFSLKGKAGCDGYQLQWSTKKSMKGAKKGLTTQNSGYIGKLKKGKTYYIRVRVYKAIGGKYYYGKWSNKKKVKLNK
mgnify:CR=1 FL=1